MAFSGTPRCTWVVLAVCLLGSSALSVASPCCDNGRFFDFELFKCVAPTEEFVTERYAEEPEATDPSIQCAYGWANFTTDSRPTDAIVEPKFKQTLQVNEYCVHTEDHNENKTTIVHCQPKPLQVNKCCPFGYAVNRTSIGECVPTEKTFNASLYVKPSGLPVTVEPNVSFTCDYDYNIFVPKMFVDQRFSVVSPGQLTVPAAMYNVFRFSTGYCVDSAVRETGEDEVT